MGCDFQRMTIALICLVAGPALSGWAQQAAVAPGTAPVDAAQARASQSPEPAAFLRWKNGDALPGTLLESQPGQIHWSSPLFADDLVIDVKALDSIFFPERLLPPSEAFRVGTVSGDVWVADLIGADQETFLFSSKRHGQVRVRRDAVHTLDRQQHANLIFEGSQLAQWNLDQDGPIKRMTYKVYQGEWSRVKFPDFTRLVPVAEGAQAAGWLDLQLARKEDNFGMVFEGQLETESAGDYTFELSSDDNARLLVDGRLLAETSPARPAETRLALTAGSHTLRVEFVELQGTQRLSAWWSGPTFQRRPLFGNRLTAAWRRAPGGHPQTERDRARLARDIELPVRVEVDLEFTSSEQPRFVLILGRKRQQAVRLETWQDELVLVQGDLFEPVLTLAEGQRDVQLRFSLDSTAGEINVNDATGDLLAKIEEVQPLEASSSIAVHNRGADLTLRRLRLSRGTSNAGQPPLDPSKERVHLIEGQVLYGTLLVDEAGAYILGADQQRQSVDLAQVARIVRPGGRLTERSEGGELSYADGVVLRGRVEQLTAEHVVLRTAFAEQPLRCALAGAAALQLATAGSSKRPGRSLDQLFCKAGRVHGRLAFAADGSPFRWYPEGAQASVRLAGQGGARLERSRSHVSTKTAFDTEAFPHVVYLQNGEVLPCLIQAYDAQTLTFHSPFVRGRSIAAEHVKGIEFSRITERLRTAVSGILAKMFSEGNDREKNEKLARALTVPRFSRENPPSHMLVAKTGDLKRGTLLGIQGQTLRFESKLRELSVPLERLARVIRISPLTGGENDPGGVADTAQPMVRATLADGSMFLFEVVQSQAEQLQGRSPLYGALTLPWPQVKRLNFAEFEVNQRKFAFRDWVVQPAQEPEFEEPTGR